MSTFTNKKQRPADAPPDKPPPKPDAGGKAASFWARRFGGRKAKLANSAPKNATAPTTPAVAASSGRRPRRKRRGLKFAGIFIVAIAAFIALLPTLLVHTPLLGIIVRRAAKLDGTLSFHSASLGWFKPTALFGIAVTDAQNNSVLEAESITIDRPLWRLITSPSNLGTLRVEKPHLSAKLTHDGSNVQTVLAHWLNSSGGASSSGVDLTVEIVDAEVTVEDTESHQTWHVGNLQFALDLARTCHWPTRVEATATVDDNGRNGTLVIKSHLKPCDGAPGTPGPADPSALLGLAGTEGELAVQAAGLPLGLFSRLAHEPAIAADAAAFDVKATAQWTGPQAKLSYEGEIAQLQPWLAAALGPTGPRIFGHVNATATVEPNGDKLHCKADGDVQQLTVMMPDGQSFQDSHLHCSLQCSYQPAAGVTVEPSSLQFEATDLYGFQVGPGELRVKLENGVLTTEATQIACNQGTLAAQAELRMTAQPMEFRMSAGTLASHVQLDESACRSGLKYVVPVLASATQSQGQFSVQLDGCRIPLGDLSRAEIGGRVIVHSATMSPGPLVRQMAASLSASPSLVRIPPESVILFRMTGGRIYHQGLVLEFPELTMRTYGSIGLDDSVKLMVETSIPLAWLPHGAVTDAIRQQKMQIPVGGTLQSPELDLAELNRVRQQVVANVAHGLLQSNLGSQLRGLIQQK